MNFLILITVTVVAFSVGSVVSWKIFDQRYYRPIKREVAESVAVCTASLKLVAEAQKLVNDANDRIKKATKSKIEEDLILSPFQVNIPGTGGKRHDQEEEED